MPNAPGVSLTLAPGARLGSYEILGPLGSGGMGEVYRARDTRLGREVAIKVLPEVVAYSQERRLRFEREARAVAALSHPNVLTIFDFGTIEGHPFAAMELLEGETLRERLAPGPLPVRKALDCAAQIARGLAAAHEKGVVHRDLKPENVMLLPDGRVKVLDFGLARLALEGILADEDAPTRVHRTDPGTVLGTVGYMAPEQVRGEDADHRADIFALGCLLYEMLTGTRAFRRGTSVETMSAILRDEPADLVLGDTGIPFALDRIVRRCLEKNPAERFQSASDLAFDLESAAGDSTHGQRALTGIRRPSRRLGLRAVAAIAAAALAAGLLGGVWLGMRTGGGAATEPAFTRLTYGRGLIRSARFAPDGRTVVYGAAWDGNPMRLFLTRTDSVESTPLGVPDGEVLAVSSAGELAVSLGHRYEGWMGEGTLARAPLLGGGARAVAAGVREAAWTPDGSDLAIVRRANGRERIEFPIEKTRFETGGYVSHLRFSRDGARLAFADHPLYADDVGYVAAMDVATGHTTRLTQLWGAGLRSLTWAPRGDEIWFTASHTGENAALRAVDMSGRQRYLLGGLTHMVIFDARPDGRLLLGRETYLRNVEALTAGDERARDFSLAREGSIGKQIAPDGRTLLITDQYAQNYATYLRRTAESSAVRLGEGEGMQLSPDGQWVVAVTPESPSRLLLHPTGPGQTREVPNPAHLTIEVARWLPDGGHILMLANTSDHKSRGYVIDVGDAATPKPITPDGTEPVRWWTLPVSPDGRRFIARAADGTTQIFRVDGSGGVRAPGLADPDVPIEWAADGAAVFVGRLEGGAWRVRRVDVTSGEQRPWMDVAPPDIAGLRVSQLFLSPDGRYYVHSYSRLLTDLYVVDGLR